MAKDARVLLGEFHDILQRNARRVVEELNSKDAALGATLHMPEQDVRALRKMASTQEQGEVLGRVLIAYGQLSVFSILGIIDGVVETQHALPSLSIINRETREEIADGFLHDEFVELAPE